MVKQNSDSGLILQWSFYNLSNKNKLENSDQLIDTLNPHTAMNYAICIYQHSTYSWALYRYVHTHGCNYSFQYYCSCALHSTVIYFISIHFPKELRDPRLPFQIMPNCIDMLVKIFHLKYHKRHKVSVWVKCRFWSLLK